MTGERRKEKERIENRGWEEKGIITGRGKY